MKIYASRLNFDSMSDREIYDYIAGKDFWVLVNFSRFDFDQDLWYIKITGKRPYSSDVLYTYDLFCRYNKPQHNHELIATSMPRIVRPIEIITDADAYDLQQFHGEDWL